MLTKIGLMQPTRKKLQLSSLPLYFILNYSLKEIFYTDDHSCKYTSLIDGIFVANQMLKTLIYKF